MRRKWKIFLVLIIAHASLTGIPLMLADHLPDSMGLWLMITLWVIPMILVWPFDKMGLPVYVHDYYTGLSSLGVALAILVWLVLWYLVASLASRLLGERDR